MNIETRSNNTMTMVIVVAVIALLAFIVYSMMNAPDTRTTGERVGDAVENLSDGVEDAGRSLQDRTPAQKAGDAVEDFGDKVERATD